MNISISKKQKNPTVSIQQHNSSLFHYSCKMTVHTNSNQCIILSQAVFKSFKSLLMLHCFETTTIKATV